MGVNGELVGLVNYVIIIIIFIRKKTPIIINYSIQVSFSVCLVGLG